jgi:Flp pilus assembly protein TadD
MLASLPYEALGRNAEGHASLRRGLLLAEKHLELNPDDVRALYLAGIALIQLGDRERALELTSRARGIDSEDSGVLYNVACVYALSNQPEEAFACLDKAITNGFGHREWLENDSDLVSLRADPRFEALLKRL